MCKKDPVSDKNKKVFNPPPKNTTSKIAWNPKYPVHLIFEFDCRDGMCILFFQIINDSINIINLYKNREKPLKYYFEKIKSYPYLYGKYFMRREDPRCFEEARRFNLQFEPIPRTIFKKSIKTARSLFSKIFIDKENCSQLIKALKNCHYDDNKLFVYIDENTNFLDAFLNLCIATKKIKQESLKI